MSASGWFSSCAGETDISPAVAWRLGELRYALARLDLGDEEQPALRSRMALISPQHRARLQSDPRKRARSRLLQ
ncbi:hypothetical protein A1D31_37000 [Bradyrhizobium liaoningense]|nr:hypothetical protein A1D31_37000 [Bradyrhizobium liaoningense]